MESQALPSEEKLREARRAMGDPEFGMNIVDRGPAWRIDIVPWRASGGALDGVAPLAFALDAIAAVLRGLAGRALPRS